MVYILFIFISFNPHIFVYFWCKVPQLFDKYKTCLLNVYMSDNILFIWVSIYVYVYWATLPNKVEFLTNFWLLVESYKWNLPYKFYILPTFFVCPTFLYLFL